MRKSLIALTIAAGMLFSFAGNAFAIFGFSVGAGVPVSYTAQLESDTGYETDGLPTGLMLYAKIPFLVGVGVEEYSQSYKNSAGTQKFTVKNKLYDLTGSLPIPIIDVSVGLGFGSTAVTCDSGLTCTDITDGATWQMFVKVDIPIFVVAGVYLSYHKVSAITKAEATISGSKTEFDQEGDLIALGLSVSF